jgi:hypothetical protein
MHSKHKALSSTATKSEREREGIEKSKRKVKMLHKYPTYGENLHIKYVVLITHCICSR